MAAQVNNASAAKGDVLITFDNVTAGGFGNVDYGQTLYVGSKLGARNYGRVRVRFATSTQLTVARNDHIKWADNLHLTTKRFHEPWSVFHKIVLDEQLNPIFYQDDDVLYGGENTDMPPIVCMGPSRALFVGESVDWTSSGSYGPSGATITAWSWSFDSGASIPSSSAAHPGLVSYNTPGHYTTKLVETDSVGKQAIGYRHVIVLDPNATTKIRKWGIASMEGSRETGGWRAKLWLREPYDLVEGSLVIVFADDWYGPVKQSIPHQYLLVGYIRDKTVRWNAYESRMEFEVRSVTGALDNKESLGSALDDVESPWGWTRMDVINVDKALAQFLQWNSTAVQVADFIRTGDTKQMHYADFVRGPVYNVVSTFLQTRLLARMVANRLGQMYCEVDANYLITGTTRNLPVTLDMTRRDWVGEPEVGVVMSPKTSYVELGGVAYTLDPNNDPTGGAFLSGAPGDVPAYEGTIQRVTGLTIDGQDQINVLAGHYWADAVNEFPQITFNLNGNYRIHDIAPQEWTRITIADEDTVARLVWDNKRCLPQTISHRYDSRTRSLKTAVTFKAETSGIPGDTIIIPVDAPEGEPDTPPPEPSPLPTPGDGNKMIGIAITSGGVYYVVATSNFLGVSPIWRDITGNLTGSGFIFHSLRRDPYNDQNRAILLTSNGVYYTTNLTASSPTWSLSLSLSAMRTLVGNGSATFIGVMQMSAAGQGYVGLTTLFYDATPGSSLSWYVYTNSYTGGVWYARAVTPMTNIVIDGSFIGIFGIAVSQYDINHVYVSIGGTVGSPFKCRVHYSSDAGQNWSSTDIESIAGVLHTNGAAVFLPYNNNPNDLLVFAGTPGTTGSGEAGVWKSTNGISGPWTLITPTGDFGRGPATPESFTESPSQGGGTGLYIGSVSGQGAASRLYRYDGSTLTEIQVGAAGDYYGWGFGGWPYDNQRLQMDNAELGVGKVGRSINGGASWIDATGNLATLISGFSQIRYLVPSWTG